MTTTSTTTATDKITNIEDAATSRWLQERLAPARTEAKAGPTLEAVARMRLRILGETAAPVKQRRAA